MNEGKEEFKLSSEEISEESLSSKLTPGQKKRVLELRRRAESAYNKQNYLWASELFGEIYTINRAEHTEYLQRMLLSSVAEKNLSGNAKVYSLKQFFANLPDYFKAMKLKDTDEGRDEFFNLHEAIIKKEPDSSFSLVKLAGAYERAGLKENAAILWESYLRTRKGDIEALRKMGDMYLAVENIEKARSAFKKIVTLKPFDQAAEKKLKDVMALTSIDESKLKGGSIRGESSKDQEASYRAQVELKSNKSEEELNYLIQQKQKEIDSNPNNLSLRYELLNYLKQKGDREKVLKTMDLILSLSTPDVDMFLEKMDLELDWIAHQNKSLPPEELSKKMAQHRKNFYRTLVDKFPTSVDLKLRMAKTLFELGENDESLKFFQITSRVADMATESMFFMGQILSRKGMSDLAIEQFQHASNLIPSMNELKKEIIYQLGLAFESLGKFELALEQYKIIYKIDMGFKDVTSRIEASYKSKTPAP